MQSRTRVECTFINSFDRGRNVDALQAVTSAKCLHINVLDTIGDDHTLDLGAIKRPLADTCHGIAVDRGRNDDLRACTFVAADGGFARFIVDPVVKITFCGRRFGPVDARRTVAEPVFVPCFGLRFKLATDAHQFGTTVKNVFAHGGNLFGDGDTYERGTFVERAVFDRLQSCGEHDIAQSIAVRKRAAFYARDTLGNRDINQLKACVKYLTFDAGQVGGKLDISELRTFRKCTRADACHAVGDRDCEHVCHVFKRVLADRDHGVIIDHGGNNHIATGANIFCDRNFSVGDGIFVVRVSGRQFCPVDGGLTIAKPILVPCCRHRRCITIDIRQGSTIAKNRNTCNKYTTWYVNLFERSTVFKCEIIDTLETVRQLNLC